MAQPDVVKRRLGRPLAHVEPRRRLTLELPQRLVSLTDAAAAEAGLNRTQLVERALAHYLDIREGAENEAS